MDGRSVQRPNLSEFELHGYILAHHGHQYPDIVFLGVERLHRADEAVQIPGGDSDGIADLEVDLHLAGVYAEPGHLLIGEGNGLGPRSDEAGDAADVADHVPGIVGHDHFDQDIAREELALDLPLFVILDLDDSFGGDPDLLDQIVEFGYRMALDHIQNFTYDPKEKREWTWEEWNQLQAERRAKEEEKQKHLKGVDIDHAPGTPAIYINENADIPEIYWSAFEHYCDLHPVKNAKQAKKRRIKFIKMVNKQYKKTYGHMATGKIKKGDKWDTVKYASVCIDKERMMENLKRIRKENVARMDYMKKQMEKWIKTNQISSEAGQKMLAHARKVRKNMQERLDDLVIDVRANGFPDVPLPDS